MKYISSSGSGDVGVACLPNETDSTPSENAICYTVGWGENSRPKGLMSSRRSGSFFFNPFWRCGRACARERTSQRPETLKEIQVSIDPPEKCFHNDDENDAQICAGSSNKVRYLRNLDTFTSHAQNKLI